MKLYVVRHGETDINAQNKINSHNDVELNDNGISQAKNLSKFIQNIDYDIVISSPLIRAKKTAELINIKNKEILFDNRIIERTANTTY